MFPELRLYDNGTDTGISICDRCRVNFFIAFCGSIVLLKKMKLSLMAGLILVQVILETVSIFSLGINFLPSTILLTAATIICSIENKVRNGVLKVDKYSEVRK